MTIKECFRACLIELNKVQAPALLLDDFVYLFNKSVQKYENKKYNLFEVNQQLTDDLRVLMKTEKLPVIHTDKNENVFGNSWTCELPEDYFHILNCICEFNPSFNRKGCKSSKTVIQQGANKLDTSQWSSIINNYYMQPSEKRPYYYISNIDEPTNVDVVNTPQDKQDSKRYGNYKKPIMQIKCGQAQLNCVYIDYLRAPKYIKLEQADLDSDLDKTQILEFPDYVIYEIINEFVQTVLENNKDVQREETFIPLNTTIAPQQTVSK